MADTLRRLGDGLELAPLEKSAFVKPVSILYQLDGGRLPGRCRAVLCAEGLVLQLCLSPFRGSRRRAARWLSGAPLHSRRPLPVPCLTGNARRWDMVQSHPSVAVLLYHVQRQAVILVRQFRPAVYVSALRAAEAAGAPRPPLSGVQQAASVDRAAWRASCCVLPVCVGVLLSGKGLPRFQAWPTRPHSPSLQSGLRTSCVPVLWTRRAWT